MVTRSRITIDAGLLQGRPVIRGTRIGVELLLRKLSQGATHADLLDAYPHLTLENIRAAIAFAAAVVSHEEIALTERVDSQRRIFRS